MFDYLTPHFALCSTSFYILNSLDTYGTSGANALAQHVSQNSKLSMKQQFTFTASNTINATLTAIEQSKTLTANTMIMVVHCSTGNLEALVRSIHARNMFSSSYYWIFSDSFSDLLQVQAGNSSTSWKNSNLQHIPLHGFVYVSLQSNTIAKDKFFVDNIDSRDPYDKFAFDAMWSLGLAVRNTLLAKQDVQNGTNLLVQLKKLVFVGASGRIKFDNKNDRLGATFIMQNIQKSVARVVASWVVEYGLKMLNVTIYFAGNTNPYVAPQKDSNFLLSTNQWLPTLISFPVRHSHAIAYIESKDEILIFGGTNNKITYGDIWSYSMLAETWTRIVPMSNLLPSVRFGAGYFSYGNSLFVYGGQDYETLLSDMWEYTARTREWSKVSFTGSTTPGGRASARMTRHGKKAYIYGGFAYGGELCSNELWEYDIELKSWRLVVPQSATRPPSKISACFGAIDSYLIIFGGSACFADVLKSSQNGNAYLNSQRM